MNKEKQCQHIQANQLRDHSKLIEIIDPNSGHQKRINRLDMVLKGNYTNAEFMDGLYKNHKR